MLKDFVSKHHLMFYMHVYVYYYEICPSHSQMFLNTTRQTGIIKKPFITLTIPIVNCMVAMAKLIAQ